MTFNWNPWVLRNKHGRPVETIKGRRLFNLVRLVLHTNLRQTWRYRFAWCEQYMGVTRDPDGNFWINCGHNDERTLQFYGEPIKCLGPKTVLRHVTLDSQNRVVDDGILPLP